MNYNLNAFFYYYYNLNEGQNPKKLNYFLACEKRAFLVKIKFLKDFYKRIKSIYLQTAIFLPCCDYGIRISLTIEKVFFHTLESIIYTNLCANESNLFSGEYRHYN